MGGYGALRNGLKYTDTFSHIVCLSGAPDDERCRMQQTVSVCCILFFCISKNEKYENKTGVWKKACGRKAGYSKDM